MIIKNLKKKFNSMKMCAVFTAVCFIMSTLGANLYAIPTAENANKKYEDVFNKVSSISNEYGKITSSKDAKSDVTVINIQDLHCHPQTQRNISKIIGQIADKYNLKSIYVEGGYGNIDTSWLNQIKDENIRKQVIEKLVEDGLLTGGEYYKLTNNNEAVELKGIDEEKLHQDNIKRLSLIMEKQDKYKELNKKISKEINFLEQRYVNTRNKRFNISIEEYLSNKIDTRRFYRQLIKYVKEINSNPDKYNNITAIRLENYPNISKFMTLRKVSKDINVREVTQQLQTVINELKSRIPYNVFVQLMKETDNFSDSQKVVELITLLCDKEGINLDNKYKSLSEFLKSNEINRELNAVELVYEERQLITEIRKALSYNNEEYEITFVSDFSRYFQDYLEYKLTDADWKYFESGYKTFRRLYGKYATIDRITEIESDIAELNKYYEINDTRNEIFVNNLLQGEQPNILNQSNLRQDEEILKSSKEVIIAITGGFHSQALEEILQAKDVNTIVITPSIFEGIEKATKQYKGIIKEQSKEFQHQALAYKIISCLDAPSQKAAMYGALKSLLGDNPEKIKEVLGDVDLAELESSLQNLQEDELNQKEVSLINKVLDIETENLLNILPKEGGKTLFFPDVDKLLLGISQELVDMGIFLSDGVVFDIENSTLNGKDLKGIPTEIYSRMHSEIQKSLFDLEDNSSADDDKDKYKEEFKDSKIAKHGKLRLKNRTESEKYDTLQINGTREQVLKGLVQNNEHYYKKLSAILTKYNLDIEKDGKLVNLLATNIYLNDNILDRIINTFNKYNIDADFKYDLLVNYVSYFEEESSTDTLFSLSDENLEFLLNIYNYQDILELEFLLGLDNLNDRLIKFREIYLDKLNLDLNLLDVSKFTLFIEEIDKIQNISKEDLNRLVLLDYHAINYILKNVSNDSEIRKIFEYADKFNLSPEIIKVERRTIEEDFKDIRYKAVIKYIGLDNEELFEKLLFGLEENSLKVVVASISDADFLRDYLLNDNKNFGDKTYSETYGELLENINLLNFRKIAVDNNYLSLKLLVNKDFNDMVSEKLSKTDMISKYFVAIFVSRFIYDSLNYEVFDYDINTERFSAVLQETLEIYSALLDEMSNKTLFGKNTKIYALCNNEIFSDGTRRFDINVFREILSNFQEAPDITSFDRAENENAISDWLNSFRDFGLYSDDSENETGYFAFMGHGGREVLQTITPRFNKIFKGKVIKANLSSEPENIKVGQLADVLFDLAIRQENKVDLRNITIDLSSCYSYLFARKVYSLLNEKYTEYKKENKDFVGTYPTIITATGLETELTYTTFGKNISNFHDMVITTLKDDKVEMTEYTLDMLAESEYKIHESNITMFVSYNNPDIRNMIEDTKKDISSFFEEEKNKTEQQTAVKEKALEGVSALPDDVVESSILRPFGTKLADKAYIWEEIVFRTMPTVASVLLVLGFATISPISFLITVPASVVMFSVYQKIFLDAHIKADWLAGKKAGRASLLRILTVPLFTSKELRKDFKDFYKSEQAKQHRKNLILPTLILSVPYVITPLFFMLTMPCLPILFGMIGVVFATVISQLGHYAYNKLHYADAGRQLSINKEQEEITIEKIEEQLKNIDAIKGNRSLQKTLRNLLLAHKIDLSKNPTLKKILFEEDMFCHQDKEKLNYLFGINTKDENYELKCQVIKKYLSVNDFELNSENKEKLNWILSIKNKDLLEYLYNGIVFDDLESAFFNEYNDETFSILGKFSKEIKDLLLLNTEDVSKNMDLLIYLLDNKEVIEGLDSYRFNELCLLLFSEKGFPFKDIITAVKDSEGLKKFIDLIKKYNLSFDKTDGNVLIDYRGQLALEYWNIDEDIKDELFKYLLKEDENEKTKDKERYLIIYRMFKKFPKDSRIFKEYLFNDKYKEKYMNLFDSLRALNFSGIASENDFLALKLLADDNFNKILDESKIHYDVPETERIVANYYSAITVSRFIYDSVANEIKGYDLSSEKFREQIEKITKLYIESLKKMKEITLIDSHTKIYELCNDEQAGEKDRFNTEAMEQILKALNINSKSVVYRRKNNTKAPDEWLRSIEKLVLEKDEEKAYFGFRGHGEGYDGKNVLVVKNKQSDKDAEEITAEQLAESLFKLSTRDQNPVSLRRVTIDLSCCYSYFFARKVYDLLRQKYEEKGIEGTYPTIITAAGLETESGFTVANGINEELTEHVGNLHEGILQMLKEKQTSAFTLDMLVLSEYQFRFSNITMFTSFADEMATKIEQARQETKQAFEEFLFETQIKDSEQDTVQENQESSEVKKDTAKKVKVPALFGGLFEASIFSDLESKSRVIAKLSKYAHVWEEISFRAVPAMLASIIILSFGTFLVSAGFASSLFVAYLISAVPGLFIFVFAQKKFIEAHFIEDWIKTQNLSGKQKFVLRIFGKYPSKQLKEDFKNFYKNERNKTKQESIKKVTKTLAVPYIVSMALSVLIPVMPIIVATTSAATVTAQVYHYKYNEKAEIKNEFENIEPLMISSADIVAEQSDLQKQDGSTSLFLSLPEKISDLRYRSKIRLRLMKQGKKQKLDDNYLSDLKLLMSKNYDLDLLLSLDRSLLADLCWYLFYEKEHTDIPEQNIRQLKELLNEYNLKYDTDNKDLRADILVEYCLNSLNVTKEQLDYLMELGKELTEKNIPYIATENDALALKIFVNDKFNSIINEKQKQYPFINTLSAKYTIALDISRDLARRIGEIENSNFVNLNDLIEKELANYFFNLVDSSSQKQIIGEQTKVIGLFADEKLDNTQKKELGIKNKEDIARFSPKAMKRLLSLLGLNQDDTDKYKFINSSEQDNAKELFFEQISKIENGEQTYLLFSGHGFLDKIKVGSQNEKDVFISVEEFANALIDLNKKGVDLSNITIDLSSCFSYFFALNMYEILKNNGVTKFPNICTTASFETPIGITTKYGEYIDSNSLISLIKVIEAQQKQEVTGLDLFKAKIEGVNSNSTFFISGKNIEDLNNSFEQDKIIELSKDKTGNEVTGARFAKQRSLMEVLAVHDTAKKKFSELPSTPKSVFELSISDSEILSKSAPIWEELAYRALPAFLASFTAFLPVMFLASTGIAGNIFVISLLSAIPGIFVFIYAQKKFIEAHLIEDWIKTQNLSGKQKFNLRVFGKFPSQRLKQDFEIFSKKEQNKIKQVSIRKATKTLVIPYVVSILLSILMPIMPVIVATTSAATITAQVYHYKYNEKVDIENELKYIEQLIINPDIITEKSDLDFMSVVRKNEARIIFKEEIKNLKEKVKDRKVIEQIKGIKVEDLVKNIDQINRYHVVFERLDAVLEQIESKNNKELEQRFLDLTERLCEVLVTLYKDETTSFHALRATKEAILNADLSVEEKYRLMIGGVMHDIGKNLIPNGILNKPGSLTAEERLVMNGHVWLGGCILKGSALYRFSNIAENHHYTEKQDKRYSARSLTDNTAFSEAEDKLAKKFSLYDVFEAVSYKLSFDSERPYQLRYYPAELSAILFDMLKEKGFDVNVVTDATRRNKLASLISEIEENSGERNALIQKLISEIVKDTEIYSNSNREIKNIILVLAKIDIINGRNDIINDRINAMKQIENEMKAETDQDKKNKMRTDLKREQKEIKRLQKEVNERTVSLVERTMYRPDVNETVLELRKRKTEAVREKAFSIVTTLNLKTAVARMFFADEEDINKVEKKIMNDSKYWQGLKHSFVEMFKYNPQLWYDRMWDMVDKDKVEFDKENFKTFLDFYFNADDEKVSDDMILFLSKIEKYYREEKNPEHHFKTMEILQKAKEYFAKIDLFGDFEGGSILSENIETVNEMLQQGKNALQVATWVALQEADISLSMEQDENGEYVFVREHGDNAGGAIELMSFIEKMQNRTKWLNNIAPKLAEKIVRQTSIIKHVIIDYKYIKASGIKQAIEMFGNDTYLDENGNVHIPPVMIVDNLEQIQQDYDLDNTGIKVNGNSIYRIKEQGVLIFGAQAADGIQVSKAINESSILKETIETMIRNKGYEGINIEVEGVIEEKGRDGISFEDGITIIGSKEIEEKSAEYISEYITSSVEIKRSMGVMYSQKAFVSLQSLKDTDKLETAIKQARARKIISKEQYEQLNLSEEEIIRMRENGIEIYIDDNEIANNLKEAGISGQIIRKDGKAYIHDYYSDEEIEIDEIGEDSAIVNIEDVLVNSQKPIMIDIKVLANKLQKENILDAYKGLNTLIGSIKIRTGLGSISQADIESLAYNIDYNKIPELGTINKENLKEATADDLMLLLQIEDNSEIGIILKAIRKNKDLDETRFTEIIKERVLAKSALKESDKEFGLKDKKLEILLGKMLLKQIDNIDKETVNIDNNFVGNKDNVIKKIMEETEKATQKDEVAINTIIEIILVYGDSYKNKQMARQLDKNDARNYRAMLAAA
ncbi:MAG: hypothetical protein J6U02_03565 [Elusimicrobia bacterium]|nr:hypothetical protein [Elusimicrobiota bacterium]